ncbi:MAG: ECF transporter S component [Defluviitaleaceae bacterium]|nr:ECF transporter S component [Defluviitaleaceae bacterium]
MTNLHLRRLIATAVFLAVSLVLRITVSGYLPLFGANGVRVGIHGVFTIMPAILFGPWYGAVASGLGDFLGHYVRPSGAWLWQITVISTVGGFMRGWAWRLLRARSPVVTRGVVVVMTLVFLGFGAISMVQLRQDGITRQFYDNVVDPAAIDTLGMSSIGRLVINRTQNTSNPANNLSGRIAEVAYAPLVAGVFGVVLLGVDMFLSKGLQKEKVSKTDKPVSIMPLALTIIIISLMISTANSIVLWAVAVPAWRTFPFVYIWLPRVFIALLTSVANVFIAVFLLRVCDRLPHVKKIANL